MSNDSDSNARCIKAVELTFRFVFVCIKPLAFFLFAVSMLGNGYKDGAFAGMVIVVVYFVVAFRQYGRGNNASFIVAGLAGLTAVSAADYFGGDVDDEDDFPLVNPSTGLTMTGGIGGVDAGGNPFCSGNNDD